jgi:Flp pilus assembly protein TadD
MELSRRFLAIAIVALAASAALGNDRPFFDGADAMGRGDYPAAVKAFDQTISQQPRIWIFHLDRAVALMMAGRGDEAGEALALANQYNRDGVDCRLWACAWGMMFHPGQTP